jgi:hypothetical protein
MTRRKFRLTIDFRTLDDLLRFADVMADRTKLPPEAVIREMDALDQSGRGIAKFIWASDRDPAPGEVIYPTLSPKWKAEALRNELTQIEESA